MYVVGRYMPLQNIHARLLAFLPHHCPNPFRHFPLQYLVSIIRDPDNMQMDRKNRVGPMSIITHASQLTQNLLKLPPKGGSFNPPNWRQ